MGSIAGLHARAASVAETPWARIAAVYGAMRSLHDSPVLRLNQAAALAWCEGPAVGLALIDDLADDLDEYSYFHSARAALLVQLERPTDAIAAYDRAIDRSDNDAEVRWMTLRRSELANERLNRLPERCQVVSARLDHRRRRIRCDQPRTTVVV